MTPFQIFISRTKKRLAAVALLPVVALAIVWRRTVVRNLTVVAVTGSVGKTTAKECLTAILRQSGRVAALSSSSNGRFGLPFLVLRSRPGDSCAHRSVAQAPLLVGAAVAGPELDAGAVGGGVAAGVQAQS